MNGKKSLSVLALSLGIFVSGSSVFNQVVSNQSTAYAKTSVKLSNAGKALSLQGAINVRDLGGYKGVDGKTIKSNRLLRSAALNNLTDSDEKELVKNKSLAVDVDLRTNYEMKLAPDKKMSGVNFVADPVFPDSLITQGTAADNGTKAEAYMEDTYKGFVDTQQSRDAYKKLFHELLSVPDNKAVLWHCSAGKDRAGMGTVLVLTALGVDKKTIINDYLLSNKYRKTANDQSIAKLKASGASQDKIYATEVENSVQKKFIDTAYKEAEKKYGSMTGFINKGLGISNDQIKELQNKYLEK